MNRGKRCISQIKAGQVSPALRALFKPTDPAVLRCSAILDGTAAGRIFTDHAEAPSWAVVQEAAFGSLYLGGDVAHRLLRLLIGRLRHCGDVLVGLWQDDPRWSLVPSGADYSGSTLEFCERDDHHFLPAIPEGGELRRLDPPLFNQLMSKNLLVVMFGSAELALMRGYGLCFLKDSELACEAFAGPAASGVIEIGVESNPRHLRKGYATLTCSHLIQTMEAQGYKTYWNCSKDNAASIALAYKLGYKNVKEYRLQAWKQW
jgi:hypothetical protein